MEAPISETGLGREWNLQDYLDLALRKKAIILIIFTLVTTIGALYSLTRPPLYYASTSFVIDENESVGVGSERMPKYFLGQEGKPIEYYQEILNSPLFTQQVLQAAGRDSVLLAMPDQTTVTQTMATVLSNRLSLGKNEHSSIMTLSVGAPDPLIAWRMAVLAVEIFRRRNQQIEKEGAQTVVSFIEKQRIEAQMRLESTERALQEFKGTGKIRLSAEDQQLVSRTGDTEALLAEIETQRKLAETNIASYQQQLKKFYASDNLPQWSLDQPEIQTQQRILESLENEKNNLVTQPEKNSGSLTQLESQIARQKAQLRQVILAQIRQDPGMSNNQEPQAMRTMLENRIVEEQVNLNSLRNKEAFYRKELAEYHRQSPQILEQAIEKARLERTQGVYQNLLNYLVERHEEEKIKASTGFGGMRIVSPAVVPEAPLSRQASRNIMVSAIMGLGLAFGLVVLQAYLDNTVRSKEELSRHTGIPVIGQIPLCASRTATAGDDSNNSKSSLQASLGKNKKNAGQRVPEESPLMLSNPLLYSKDNHTIFTESFRNLRTDLQFIQIDNPVKKLLISSAVPGEGKSMITANIGLAFAELGKRVLIVDCDLRKPRQHTQFSISRIPGLTDILTSGFDPATVIQQVHAPDLYLLPAGSQPPNPSEILHSNKIIKLIDRLEKEYDYILIDSPPLLSLSDARIISGLVPNILMVYLYGKTDIRHTKDAVHSIKSSQATIVGIVLNGIEPHRNAYYKYHYYNYLYSETTQNKN